MDTVDVCYIHHPEVRWRELGSQVVVLHQRRGAYYTLNELGAFLWKSINGRTRLGHILEKIVEHYDVDPDTARSDLLETAQDLVREGLISDVEDCP